MGAAASSDDNAIHTMRPCAQSCSTDTDSRGSPRAARPTAAMRGAGDRALRLRRREDRCRPGGNGARARGRRAAQDGARVALDPPPSLRRVRALRGRPRVDVRGTSPPRRSCPAGFAEEVAATDGHRAARRGRRCDRHLRRAARLRPSRRRARSARDASSSSGRASWAGCSPRCCAGAATPSSRATSAPSATDGEPDGRSTRSCSARPLPRSTRSSRAGRCSSSPNAGRVELDEVYRRELTLVGSRSATPAAMREAAALLPELELPEPTVLPLARFAEGLELYRSGRALKVVFTP